MSGVKPVKPTQRLHDAGQSLWIDDITRDMLDSGRLGSMIAELSVTGLTSNPTIFEKSIGSGSHYDAAVEKLLRERNRHCGDGIAQRLRRRFAADTQPFDELVHTPADIDHVPQHDGLEQSFAGSEVVVHRRVVPHLGHRIEIADAYSRNSFTREQILTRPQQSLPRGKIRSHGLTA